MALCIQNTNTDKKHSVLYYIIKKVTSTHTNDFQVINFSLIKLGTMSVYSDILICEG